MFEKFPHCPEGSEAAGECVPPLAFIHKVVPPPLPPSGTAVGSFPTVGRCARWRAVAGGEGGDGLLFFFFSARQLLLPHFIAAPSCLGVFLERVEKEFRPRLTGQLHSTVALLRLQSSGSADILRFFCRRRSDFARALRKLPQGAGAAPRAVLSFSLSVLTF